jgi:hypothetical protein
MCAPATPRCEHSRRPLVCTPRALSTPTLGGRREHNSAALFAEIQQQGFTGGLHRAPVCARLAGRSGVRTTAPLRCGRHSAAKPTSLLAAPDTLDLARPVDELDTDERAYREALSQESAAIATAQALAEDFGRIVRGGPTPNSTPGCGRQPAATSELVSFERGLR